MKDKQSIHGENLVIDAFNLALLIAATVYHEVAAEDPQVAKEMQEADPKTCVLYDLVAKASGVPVVPVKPPLQSSTDESTKYIFEGVQQHEDSFKLVSNESLKSRDTRSLYTLNELADMSGMRVKLLHTMTASGNYAPLFATLYL
jgi:hypothetical protein